MCAGGGGKRFFECTLGMVTPPTLFTQVHRARCTRTHTTTDHGEAGWLLSRMCVFSHCFRLVAFLSRSNTLHTVPPHSFSPTLDPFFFGLTPSLNVAFWVFFHFTSCVLWLPRWVKVTYRTRSGSKEGSVAHEDGMPAVP